MLAQTNSRYETELARHYEPGGLFQQAILAKYKEESTAIMEGLKVEYEKRMQELEREYEARQNFWDNKERQLNLQFQVCNNEWP